MINSENSILPDSLRIFPQFAAFDLSVAHYLEQVKLDMLLVYFIDRVDAKALPILAKQFDVLGYKGWKLTTTEQQRRDLLKRAIELHRYKGTLWAVRESLKSIGFEDIRIEEHVEGHWAKFSLFIDNQTVELGVDSFAQIIAMVEEYKNVRSYLTGLTVAIITDDVIRFDEDDAEVNEEIAAEDTIFFSAALFYDGVADYDGTYDHSGDSDVVDIV